MAAIKYRPIGVIHSPYKKAQGTPIQPTAAVDVEGSVEVFSEYVEGLKDIEGFSHIVLVYHFHLSKEFLLKVKPYMNNSLRGIFATRAPARPNPIGISAVRLIKVEDNILHIKDVDVVDRTPLLDIKPYVPKFDLREAKRIGWLQQKIHKLSTLKDDGRFT